MTMGESEDVGTKSELSPASSEPSLEAARAARASEATESVRAARAAEASRVEEIAQAATAAEAARIAEIRRQRREKWDRWKTNLRWHAFRLLPGMVRAPYSQRDRAYQQARDEEQNKKSQIPSELNLRCPIIWGVELYGPLEIEALYAGIEKLEWSRIGARHGEPDAVERIREQRASGAGGWMNVGPVLPEGKASTFGLTENRALLPEEVESLLVRVFQVTPSLTAVFIGFRLTGARTERYEREVNQDRSTIYRPVNRPKAITWVEPSHQKKEAVSDARRGLRSMVGDWFAKNLPGYFCGSTPRSQFPTLELLVAQGSIWLDDLANWSHWRRLLIDSVPYELWSSDDVPGLQLTFERHHDESQGLHLIAGLDATRFPEDKLQGIGSSKPGAYAWYCDQVLDGILVHSATVEYLSQQRRDLNLTRDRMKRVRSGWRHLSRTLGQISGFFDRTLGSSVVARELEKLSDDAGWYRHDCGGFTAPTWDDKGVVVLDETLRKRVAYQSSQFASEESSLREHFEQFSTILGVRESLRATRRMELLTVFALAVGLASLIVALPSLDQTTQRLETFWRAALSAAFN
jgi:hypothetical protein